MFYSKENYGSPALAIAFAVLPVALTCLCSCSIKEDRQGCPCRLYLDFSEADPVRNPELVLNISDGNGLVWSDTLRAESCDGGLYPSEYMVEVPRNGVYVNVWSGVPAEFLADSGLIIPSGRDCPPVYMHNASVGTDGEIAYDSVVLHKNYCSLTLNFVQPEDGFPYRLRLSGLVDGYCLDGSLKFGEFLCPLELSSVGSTVVNVPRQADGSLCLHLTEDGTLLKTFAVGNYIEASGYDWNALDLGDLTIDIDYSNAKVTLKTSLWEETFSYEFVI